MKLCEVCDRPVTAYYGERPSVTKKRKTCSKECADEKRSATILAKVKAGTWHSRFGAQRPPRARPALDESSLAE